MCGANDAPEYRILPCGARAPTGATGPSSIPATGTSGALSGSSDPPAGEPQTPPRDDRETEDALPGNAPCSCDRTYTGYRQAGSRVGRATGTDSDTRRPLPESEEDSYGHFSRA